MALEIAPSIQKKLAGKNPPVTAEEIVQCFANTTGMFLYDTREDNKTDPPTKWFIAETDYGRKLKIVFIQDGKRVIIKTAYQPNNTEKALYRRITRQVD